MDVSVDFEVLSALEQAIAPVWNQIDDVTTSFTQYENSRDGDDITSRLQDMRKSYTSSLQLLHWLEAFKRTMCDRIEQFEQQVGRFETHISLAALNYGLNLLPDEVLSEIFVLATTTLEEKVALSLICKRFRRVMMSMRRMWDGQWIESSQPPEQIIAIAEGNGFVSLKARILPPSPAPSYVKTWVAKRRLDVEEYTLRYHKFSVGLILSYRPEELEFRRWGDLTREGIEPILAAGRLQNLRKLVLQTRDSAEVPRIRGLETLHAPLLRHLEVDFVPGPTVARNLVRCKLTRIEEAQFDALQDFLAAAESLQDLLLFLSRPNATPTFNDACDLPSLQVLEVNFVPKLSVARRLIQFRLVPSLRVIVLAELLDFLSSSELLQELFIRTNSGFVEDPDTIDMSPAATMSSVVTCKLPPYEMGAILMGKLHMPVLRTLKLDLYGLELDDLSSITRNEFRTSLQSIPSLEDLELNGPANVRVLDEIIRYAPPHIETFLLNRCTLFFSDGDRWTASPAPLRKHIHFKDCTVISSISSMPTFVDYLRDLGLSRMEIQFSNCAGWRNGTFGLDDVMEAWIGT